MLSFLWTDAYLAKPTINVNRSNLDNQLRTFKRGTREVMSREHNFGAGTPNDGKHSAGKIEVAKYGSTATRDALSDVPTGALFVVQSGGVSDLYAYDGSTWVKIGTNDHSALANLAQNDHTQYYLNAGETLEGKLYGGGYQIQYEDSDVAESVNGVVTSKHLLTAHSPLGNIAAVDLTGPIGVAKLKKEFVDIDATYNPGGISVPGNKPSIDLNDGHPISLPNIQVEVSGWDFPWTFGGMEMVFQEEESYYADPGLRVGTYENNASTEQSATYHIKCVRFYT